MKRILVSIPLVCCADPPDAQPPPPTPPVHSMQHETERPSRPKPATERGPLPHGIDHDDRWDDPKRQCEVQAESLTPAYKRRGVGSYCKWRIWAARRDTKEPKPRADGTYIHRMDMPSAVVAWGRGRDAGLWDRACEHHSIANAEALFTRGKWFDVSYRMGHLLTTDRPLPCWDPEIFDWNNVGARLVVERATRLCMRHRRHPCTRKNLRRWWRETTLWAR